MNMNVTGVEASAAGAARYGAPTHRSARGLAGYIAEAERGL